MKARLLIILFVLVLISVQPIYAPPAPNPKTAFDYAEHVVVGKILSVKILSKPNVQTSENSVTIQSGIALYEIEVEEYLKNPLDVKIIKVPGYYIDQESSRSGFDSIYKVNQRVLLYIQADYPDTLVDYDLLINRESRILDGPVCDLGTSYQEGLCVKNSIEESSTLQITLGLLALGIILVVIVLYTNYKRNRK
jgi:hypothetical protein